MKFTESEENIYKNMIGKKYKSKNTLGIPKIKIVGYGYNPKRKVFFYIFETSYLSYGSNDGNYLKKKLNELGYQIKQFDSEDYGSYMINDCESFDKYYYPY